MDWRDTLITLFVYVCQKYNEELWTYCQRMSNNQAKPDFLDCLLFSCLYLFTSQQMNI